MKAFVVPFTLQCAATSRTTRSTRILQKNFFLSHLWFMTSLSSLPPTQELLLRLSDTEVSQDNVSLDAAVPGEPIDGIDQIIIAPAAASDARIKGFLQSSSAATAPLFHLGIWIPRSTRVVLSHGHFSAGVHHATGYISGVEAATEKDIRCLMLGR